MTGSVGEGTSGGTLLALDSLWFTDERLDQRLAEGSERRPLPCSVLRGVRPGG